MALKTLTILGQKPSALRKEIVAAAGALVSVAAGAAAFSSALPGWAQAAITGAAVVGTFVVTALTKGAKLIDATDNL